MRDGFIKVAAVTTPIQVADCEYNLQQIRKAILELKEKSVKIAVFPELCLTGYTCGDLFLQNTLTEGAKRALLHLAKDTEGYDGLIFVGLPLVWQGKLYNVAAAIQNGNILGMIPKENIPNYSEFYEKRYFVSGPKTPVTISFAGQEIPFGTHLLFGPKEQPDVLVGAEICEDLWVPVPPSCAHGRAGATILCNLSASNEVIGKAEYRRKLISSQSARLAAAYLYADAGEGESTQDLVFAGHNLIGENGTILTESKRFTTGILVTEIDVDRLLQERKRMNTYPVAAQEEAYQSILFHWNVEETELTRPVESNPFFPEKDPGKEERLQDLFTLQAEGLKKRLKHIGCSCAVVGISGGLDSTLALLVTVEAFQRLHLPLEGIYGITMPGFGTTKRTYDNASALMDCLGVSKKEIPISSAVLEHFSAIGHDPKEMDVTYENSQARERTQILMDFANQKGGIVIGTGDLSELALGWATYNGDHMSMYGVNASIPKTLVRHIIGYQSRITQDETLKTILLSILDTPVSPELLPGKEGEITQKTEDLVGPYELHDFFLYYLMRFAFSPRKIYRLACYAFSGDYAAQEILKWLQVFYGRFFSQQFKRSCLPDGAKVGTVALSPRGDLRMPSDASYALWKEELTSMDNKNIK